MFDLVPTEDSTSGRTRDGRSLALCDPPGQDATDIDKLTYIHYQLDTLDGQEVLQGLTLQQGYSSRLQGGVKLSPCLPYGTNIIFCYNRKAEV